MYRSFSDLLTEILTIIRFQNSKETFVREFESANYLETALNLLDDAPDSEIPKIKKLLEEGNVEKLKAYFAAYVGLENFHAEMNKVRTHALRDFLKHILPTLSSEQIRRIDTIVGDQISY